MKKGDADGGSGVGTQNREKKIKPIKQPVKLQRPPTLLDKVARIDDSLGRNEREKGGRVAPGMAQSVGEERKNVSRESVCTGLLESGNVQAFIDLFYIAHKCLPNLIEEEEYFGHKVRMPEYSQFDSACRRRRRSRRCSSGKSSGGDWDGRRCGWIRPKRRRRQQ